VRLADGQHHVRDVSIEFRVAVVIIDDVVPALDG